MSRDVSRLGGEFARLHRTQATVYDRVRKGVERKTVLDTRNAVRPLLSSKLPLNREQRAVGTYYAHCVESKSDCRSGDLTMERVDGGSSAGSDAALVRAYTLKAERIANEALAGMQAATFNARGASSGPHSPIFIHEIVSAVCVSGMTLTDVGMKFGWYSSREIKRRKTGKMIERIVPDRQRKVLSEALVNALDGIKMAWDDNWIAMPDQLYSVEIHRD